MSASTTDEESKRAQEALKRAQEACNSILFQSH